MLVGRQRGAVLIIDFPRHSWEAAGVEAGGGVVAEAEAGAAAAAAGRLMPGARLSPGVVSMNWHHFC